MELLFKIFNIPFWSTWLGEALECLKVDGKKANRGGSRLPLYASKPMRVERPKWSEKGMKYLVVDEMTRA